MEPEGIATHLIAFIIYSNASAYFNIWNQVTLSDIMLFIWCIKPCGLFAKPSTSFYCGCVTKAFFLFSLQIQHKAAAPNDLRDPKTKDTLHPTGWMAPQASACELDRRQILAQWQGRAAGADGAGFDKLSISTKLRRRGRVRRVWRSAVFDKHCQGLHKILDQRWGFNPGHNSLQLSYIMMLFVVGSSCHQIYHRLKSLKSFWCK